MELDPMSIAASFINCQSRSDRAKAGFLPWRQWSMLLAELRLGHLDAVIEPASLVSILAAVAQYLKRVEPRFKRLSMGWTRGERNIGEMKRRDCVPSL